LKKNNRTIEGILEIDRGAVRFFAPGVTTGTTARSIEELDASLLKGKTIHVVLGRSLTFVRSIALPEATASDTAILVRGKLGDLFPVPPVELSHDLERTNNLTGEGRTVTVYATRNEVVNSVLSASQEIGFELGCMTPVSSLALAGVGGQGNAIVVERLPGGYGLDVLQNGVLLMSRAVGENHSIESEIARLQSLFGDSTPAIFASTGLLEGARATSIPPLATTVPTDPTIDLEPASVRENREQKARESRKRIGLVVFLAGFSTLALAINDYYDGVAKVEQAQKKANAEVSRMTKLQTLVEGEVNKLNPKAEKLNRAFQPAQRLSDMAKIISQITPDGTWLNGIVLERGKMISIRGTAKDPEGVATFVKALAEQKRFRDVKLLFANSAEIESEPVVQFSVTAIAVGNLPVIDASKKR